MDCAARLHVQLHQRDRIGRQRVEPRLERCYYELHDLEVAIADAKSFRGDQRSAARVTGGPVESVVPLDTSTVAPPDGVPPETLGTQ